MRDMGPILAELEQLRKENERLKEMLVDTYGFGWTMEYAQREKEGKFKDLRNKGMENMNNYFTHVLTKCQICRKELNVEAKYEDRNKKYTCPVCQSQGSEKK